jgi:hypothetical protein
MAPFSAQTFNIVPLQLMHFEGKVAAEFLVGRSQYLFSRRGLLVYIVIIPCEFSRDGYAISPPFHRVRSSPSVQHGMFTPTWLDTADHVPAPVAALSFIR